MASVPRTPNEGTPFPVEPFVFPSFGNIGPPYISTLSLPGFTIELPVWFFSKNINLMSTLFLLHPSGLLPFLPPHLVKVLMLVTRRIRRRRKGRTRRRKISKGEIHQLLLIMLGVLMILTSLPRQLTSPNSLAIFVRVTTFLRISLVFPRY
jgi:hypothetical protein